MNLRGFVCAQGIDVSLRDLVKLSLFRAPQVACCSADRLLVEACATSFLESSCLCVGVGSHPSPPFSTFPLRCLSCRLSSQEVRFPFPRDKLKLSREVVCSYVCSRGRFSRLPPEPQHDRLSCAPYGVLCSHWRGSVRLCTEYRFGLLRQVLWAKGGCLPCPRWTAQSVGSISVPKNITLPLSLFYGRRVCPRARQVILLPLPLDRLKFRPESRCIYARFHERHVLALRWVRLAGRNKTINAHSLQGRSSRLPIVFETI